MPYAAPVYHLRNTPAGVSDIKDLSLTAGAASETSSAAYSLGGLTSWRQFQPGSSSSSDRQPPSVGDAPLGWGWRFPALTDRNVVFQAGTWQIVAKYTRSGGSNQSGRLTAVLYVVTSAGVLVQELGRATTADLTFTTVEQSVLLEIAVPAVTVAAGNTIQIEMFVQSFNGGIAGPPTQAVTLRVLYNTNATSFRFAATPYQVTWIRAFSTSTARTVALSRALTLGRAFSASTARTASVDRTLTLARAFATTVTHSPTVTRTLALARSFSASTARTATGERTLAISRTFSVSTARSAAAERVLAVARTFSVSTNRTTALSRSVIAGRAFAVTVTRSARMRLELPQSVINRMVSGGGTVVRRFIAIFED